MKTSDKRAPLILIGIGMIVGGLTGIPVGLILASSVAGRVPSWADILMLILCAMMIIETFRNTPSV